MQGVSEPVPSPARKLAGNSCLERGQISPIGRNDTGKSRNNNGLLPIEYINVLMKHGKSLGVFVFDLVPS